MTILDEISDRIARGYRAELLFNFETGENVVTTWLDNPIDIDHKQYVLSKDSYSVAELRKIVYGI